MANNPIFINSRYTNGHWALKNEKSNKPFENPLSIYAKVKLYKNDIIADIGAYIGEYSMYAVNQGVYQVLCYEPTPGTFEILQKNQRPGMNLFNLAVVGGDEETVRLFISKGIGVTNSIVKTKGKAGIIEVPAIRYEKAIAGSTVVKIDVEGAEYLYNIIQPNLRAIILEFHPLNNNPWRQWAEKIMDDIILAGYKEIYRPNFKSGWSLTGCWEK